MASILALLIANLSHTAPHGGKVGRAGLLEVLAAQDTILDGTIGLGALAAVLPPRPLSRARHSLSLPLPFGLTSLHRLPP